MTEHHPDPPAVIGGRYRLVRLLGHGGMAKVHLAHDEVLGRDVAVKVLFAKLADDERFVARFRREASSAANLNHPNIVQVYDWHAEGDYHVIVMEYVQGRDLSSVIHDGPVPAEQVLRIGAAAAAALACAHGAGILHRDIKPGNILVTPTGDVKVADFGVARAFDNADKLTETGRVMGTAQYFSPEQAKGGSLGPQSDLYSLGVVLFEAVTGEPLFDGSSPVDVAYKQVNEKPRRARAVVPTVPSGLDAAIDRLLAKDPAARHPSAIELGAELERILDRLLRPGPGVAHPTGATAVLPRLVGPATTVMPPLTRPDEARGIRQAGGRPVGGRIGLVLVVASLAVVLAIVVLLAARLVGSGDEPGGSTSSTTIDPDPTSGSPAPPDQTATPDDSGDADGDTVDSPTPETTAPVETTAAGETTASSAPQTTDSSVPAAETTASSSGTPSTDPETSTDPDASAGT